MKAIFKISLFFLLCTTAFAGVFSDEHQSAERHEQQLKEREKEKAERTRRLQATRELLRGHRDLSPRNRLGDVISDTVVPTKASVIATLSEP